MQWNQVTALVTGGAGFIGSNLSKRLLSEGANVVVVDDFSSGKRENLAFAENEDRFRLVEADIRDFPTLSRAMMGVDAVFHMAALASVPASVADPQKAHEVNVTGSLNVLRAAQENGVKRVVVSGSAAVYGNGPELPKNENMRPEPESPYASNKIAMEYYAADFTRFFGVDTAILRYFNVFGPQQDPQSAYAAVIPIFVTKLLKGERPVIFGDGEQTRDFVYIDDVVEANLKAAAAPASACAKPMNVAGGQRVSVNRLFYKIRELIGSDLEPDYQPERPGDVKHSTASVDRARDEIGFEAAISVEEGLERSIDWYRAHLSK